MPWLNLKRGKEKKKEAFIVSRACGLLVYCKHQSFSAASLTTLAAVIIISLDGQHAIDSYIGPAKLCCILCCCCCCRW